jgi:hypothetical protein
LAIGFVILTLSAMVTIASYRMPADGWLVDRGDFGRYTNPVYLTSLPGTNPNLQPGDVLLKVDGEPFEVLEARAAALKSIRPANWEIGQTVQYTLLQEAPCTSFVSMEMIYSTNVFQSLQK